MMLLYVGVCSGLVKLVVMLIDPLLVSGGVSEALIFIIENYLVRIIPFIGIILFTGLALLFRRMHDTGKSAWLLIPCIIPMAGQIFMMLWFLKDSQPGENQWGPNPKGV